MIRSERGQTTLDFAFGIGVFLLAVAFIIMFIPDLIAPFNTPSTDGDKIQSERTANLLITEVLSTDQMNSHLTTLDPECTTQFFKKEDPPNRCGFTEESMFADDELQPSALGLDSSTNLQIQLLAVGDSTVENEVGESPPRSQSIQQWTRIVTVSNQEYRLQVRVW